MSQGIRIMFRLRQDDWEIFSTDARRRGLNIGPYIAEVLENWAADLRNHPHPLRKIQVDDLQIYKHKGAQGGYETA